MKNFKSLWIGVWITAMMLMFGCTEEKSEKKDDAVLKAVPGKNKTAVAEKEVAVKPTAAGKDVEEKANEEIKKITSGAAVQPFATENQQKPQGMTIKDFFAEQELPEVVAVVGDDKITKDELIKDIEAQLPAQMRNQPLPPQVTAGLAQNMKMVVDTIISRKLLLKLAAEDGIKPSPRLLLDKFNDFLEKMPADQKAMFEKQLAAQGTSIAKQKEQAMNDVSAQEAVAIDKWIETKLLPKVKIDEAAAKKFYQENHQRFKKPGTVKVAHILIAPEKPDLAKYKNMSPEEKKKVSEKMDQEAKAKADEILAKVLKGEDFSKLAKDYSSCPSKADGGKLPEFDKNGITPGSGPRAGRMDKIFTKASFELKPGEVTQKPVKTHFGYHIIKSEKKIDASFIPFEQVKEGLIIRLKKEKLRKEVKAMIDAEKEKSKVKIFI